MKRSIVVGLVVAMAAAAVIGGSVGAAGPDASVAPPAPSSGAPRLVVTKVTASSTTTSTGAVVRTTVTVTNTSAARRSAVDAWLSLTAGSKRYSLGHATVQSLAGGASTTLRATHTVPPRAPAGKYAVLACTGAFSPSNCRASEASVTTARATHARPDTGVMLDVARAYYPVALVKQYIALLADHGGRFLHLHLTDDQNVGIESEVLGQTLANADLRDGIYTSRITGRSFLSAAQAREISRYAARRGIAIVPEIDTPGHMAAAFTLLEAGHGKQWVDRIRSGESELDTSVPESSALAERLLQEVTRTFPSSRTVHIGGDEWGGDATADERVQWLNTMAVVVGNRAVWAWNDGIDRSALGGLDPRIHVTYWSFDGDTEDATERHERRERRARAIDLYAAGIDLLNYNSYYLYEVPTDLDAADSEYTVADLRANWSLRAWDGNSGARLAGPMSGAAVAIWGEDLEAPPSDALLRWSAPHVIAMIETAGS